MITQKSEEKKSYELIINKIKKEKIVKEIGGMNPKETKESREKIISSM